MNKKSIKEYRIWKAMKSRCYSPSQQNGYYKKRQYPGMRKVEKQL